MSQLLEESDVLAAAPEGTDAVIAQLAELFEVGDIIIDAPRAPGIRTAQTRLTLVCRSGGIVAAVFARSVSSHPEQRGPVQAMVDARPEIATELKQRRTIADILNH